MSYNVAFVHTAQLATRFGGTSRVTETWTRVLTGSGHRIRILALEETEDWLDEISPLVSTHLVPHFEDRPFWSRSRRRVGALAGRLAELARQEPFDLAVAADVLAVEAIRRALPEIPLLADWHSPLCEEGRVNHWLAAPPGLSSLLYPLRDLAYRRVEGRAIRQSDHAVTESCYTRDLLLENYPRSFSRLRWTLIPGMVDTERFRRREERATLKRRLGWPEDRPVLFTLRRLAYRMGIDRILLAAQAARAQGVKAYFPIGGSGPLLESLRSSIAARGLEESVELLGFVSEEKLADMYSAADAFLLPTRHLEGFGLIAIESLACGTPVLASRTGAPVEILDPFPEMLSAKNTDESFVDLVLSWLQDTFRRDEAELVRHVEESYSFSAVGPRLLELVEDVASRPR